MGRPKFDFVQLTMMSFITVIFTSSATPPAFLPRTSPIHPFLATHTPVTSNDVILSKYYLLFYNGLLAITAMEGKKHTF